MLAAVATILSVGIASDPLSSTDLRNAMDASLMQLFSNPGWFESLRVSNGYPDALQVMSCTPSEERWPFPDKDSATGLLRRVLDTGELKVAGVQWVRGGQADYKSDPENPSGFWPSMMNDIVEKMSLAYNQNITIKRVYYSSSPLAIQKVEEGEEVDCSAPYYYLSGFHSNSPRILSHEFSCITAGTASVFYTKNNSGITTLKELYDKIESCPDYDASCSTVGFIAEANYWAVSSMLPANTRPSYQYNATNSIDFNVQSGNYIAGYVSEGLPPNPETFHVFPTGSIDPRVILYRQDVTDSDGDTIINNGNDGVTGALIVVAAVTLVLAVLLAWVIVKERRGSPLFMPLISSHSTTSAVDMAAKPSTPNSSV